MAYFDDSDENLAASSFRARANTWPMNRPENTLQGSLNIDEPLPEIQLDDHDFFTISENWSGANQEFADQDIMSWTDIDPIQNPQSMSISLHNHQQLSPHTQQLQNIDQQSNIFHSQQSQQQQQQQQFQHNTPITLNNNNNNDRLHHHLNNIHPEEPSLHASPAANLLTPNQQHLHILHHQTLNSSTNPAFQSPSPSNSNQNSDPNASTEDGTDYHIRQLNQLRLGSGLPSPPIQHQQHQHNYLSSSICLGGKTLQQQLSSQQNDSYANLTPEHHQQMTTYDLNTGEVDNPNSDQLHQLRPLFTSHKLNHQLSSSHQLLPSINTTTTATTTTLSQVDYASINSSLTLTDTIDNQQGFDSLNIDSSILQSASTKNGKLSAPRRNAWGNMSYADLISQAIDSTVDKRLTLSQIYDWMVQHIPYFKNKGDSNSSAGWKNSVRHNLSLHSRFKRVQNEGAGKSSWWTINPEASIGKCARRRAASMEATKYEKKRRGAKKRADAIRSGLVPYYRPSTELRPAIGNSSDKCKSDCIATFLGGTPGLISNQLFV